MNWIDLAKLKMRRQDWVFKKSIENNVIYTVFRVLRDLIMLFCIVQS